MATAYVELAGIAFKGMAGFSLHGRCIRTQQLTISGSTATLTTAVDRIEGIEVVRIVADTACFFAIGVTPDPTLTAKTNESSAGRYLPAGAEFTGHILHGEKIAVHS